MLFKNNLILLLIVLFATYRSPKVCEVCVCYLFGPSLCPCSRESAKWLWDLTGNLRDKTLMTFTKDCNSPESVWRQKARQQLAKETTPIHSSLKTGKWIENITRKANFLIASILSLQMWASVKFSWVLTPSTFICYSSISHVEKQTSSFSGVNRSIWNTKLMPERANAGFQDLINHLDYTHIFKISNRKRHILEYTFWKEFIFQPHTNKCIMILSWLLLWELLVVKQAILVWGKDIPASHFL